MSEQKKKKVPFSFRRIVLDDDEAGIETDAGVLCEVMINGTKNISYVPKSFLSSLGVQLPKNLQDKENCSFETVDTSRNNLQSDVRMPASSGSMTAISTASPVLLPTFNSSNAAVKWGDHDTKMLLDLYAENLNQVGPFKKFKTKKKMWEHIAFEISTTFSVYVNGQQCESRFKTVRNRKGLAVTHNKQSGNDTKVVPYQEMDNIRSIDDSVQPEVLVSVGNTRVLKQKAKEDAVRSGPKKKKQDPMLARYLELQEKKEENKERRHQEKMKNFREYCLKKQSE